MAEGVIKSLLERFGFIKPRDGTDDVHFRRDQAPRDCREGDHVEYDPEDGPKGPRVRGNIRIIQRSQRQGGQQQQGQQGQHDQRNLHVQWVPGEPELREYDGAQPTDPKAVLLRVPMTVILREGNRFKQGAKIRLKVWASDVTQPLPEPETTDKGEAYFVAFLSETATDADFAAFVHIANQLVATSSFHWRLDEHQVKPRVKIARHIKVKAVGTDGDWTLVRIYTATSKEADADGIKSGVIVGSVREVEVEGVGTKGSQVKIETETNGYVTKKVRFTKPHKGEVAFALEHDLATEDSLEIETKEAEVKTVRHIRARNIGTDSTWTSVRVILQVADKPEAEKLEADIRAESDDAIEIESVSGGGNSIKVKIDGGEKIIRVKRASVGKAEVTFRLDSNTAVESDPIKIETKAAETKQVRYIRAQKIGTDSTWTTIRILTLTSNKPNSEMLEGDVLAECGSEIEVEGAATKGHSVGVKIDNGSKLVRIKLAKAGKADVIFRSKEDIRVESEPVEIETKAAKTCKRIKAELVLGRPGSRNTLKVETFAEVGDNADKISAGVEIESADEIVVEVDGTEHRGKLVRFSTDTTGTKVVKIVFVAPVHSGHVNLFSSLNRSVAATNVFVRHPATESRP
ncbi:MAG: cold shock domain-containing protein [Candidatus Doudnabacteria bacterium]|nr:cold shock domain-containing protein [Candidatus Doudnabacteria bacterium]